MSPPNPRKSSAFRGSYLVQAIAHCYFLSSGIWLWFRWEFRRVFQFGGTEVLKERAELVHRFQVYLGLLERWEIIKLEYVGFEDAASWHGSLIAPNHPSIIDVIIIMSRVPSLNCVMNSRLLKSPITSGAAKLCDFIKNDSIRSMLRDCKANHLQGSNILIFPEGTRTTTPPLGPFNHSFALVSKFSGAPIRTIFIECDSDYFGRKFSFFKSARCPIRFRVTAGRVFQCDPATSPRLLSAEIEDYFHDQLSGAKG